jgi:hypothetical protein
MNFLCLHHCIHVCLLIISHLSDLIFEHGLFHSFFFHSLLHHGLVVVIRLLTSILIAASESLHFQLLGLLLNRKNLPLQLLLSFFLFFDHCFLLLKGQYDRWVLHGWGSLRGLGRISTIALGKLGGVKYLLLLLLGCNWLLLSSRGCYWGLTYCRRRSSSWCWFSGCCDWWSGAN